jgi:hypothetical protein
VNNKNDTVSGRARDVYVAAVQDFNRASFAVACSLSAGRSPSAEELQAEKLAGEALSHARLWLQFTTALSRVATAMRPVAQLRRQQP